MPFSKSCLDLSQGYQGDITESHFKPLTGVYLPHWWLFREIIRAGDGSKLMTSSGQGAPTKSQELLLKLAYVGHEVHMSATSAVQFARQASAPWQNRQHAVGIQNARRYLKAYYENLYSLAGGLANTYAVLFKRHEFTTGNVMVGPTRGQALGSSDQQEKDVGKILQELEKHLQMRHQEVHFWVQIAAVLTTPGRSEVRLGVYKDFQKASLPVAGSTAVPPTKFEDAWQVQLPEIFDLVDRAYKVFCGRADAWLTGRGEVIDYSDFSTHGNAKPIPVPCTYMGDDPLLRPW